MIYLIIILITSFFLEGLFSNIVSMNDSFFIPLFTVISLVASYPYFKKADVFFWKIALGIGFCYDIIYTNTVFIHAILFLLLSYYITLLYRFFSNHIWHYLGIILLVIIGYRLMSFLLLVLIGYIPFSLSKLGLSIVSSILCNMIFSLFLYGTLKLCQKHKMVIYYH